MPETMVNTEEETSFDIFEENDFQTDTENEDSSNEDNSDKGENKKEVNSAENEEKEAETMLPVKFLGKEYPIPEGEVKSLAERLGIKEDDVITTIQKGLNYDHAVNNTPLHKQIAKLAELNGKTPEEYSKFLEQSIGQISLRHEIDKVRKEYPELSDEAVEIIAQKNVENSELANYKAAKENEESKKKQEEQDRENLQALLAANKIELAKLQASLDASEQNAAEQEKMINVLKVEVEKAPVEFLNSLCSKLRIEYLDFMESDDMDMSVDLGENFRDQLRNVFAICIKAGMKF